MTKLEDQVAALVRARADDIRSVLAQLPTSEVVGRAFMVFRMTPTEALDSVGLASPYRETMYILGLMLSTREPSSPDSSLYDDNWSKACKFASDASHAYIPLFIRSREEVRGMSLAERLRYEVAGMAFFHYFNTGVLASADQLLAEAKATLVPFDRELSELVGLSATDVLEMTEWLVHRVQDQADRWLDSALTLKRIHEKMVAERWSISRAMNEVKKTAIAKPELRSDLNRNFLSVGIGDFETKYGVSRVHAYRTLLASTRGEDTGFRFFADESPATLKPLLVAEDGTLLLPVANALFMAAVQQLIARLERSPLKAAYLRRRDKALEQRVETAIRQFFPNDAQILSGISEQSNGQFEHDLIITWRDTVLVLEAKAAARVVPFRDAVRGFERIKSAFQRDSGLQGAYEQARRPLRTLREGRVLELYNRDGVQVATIDPSTVRRSFAICVTSEDFGPLATDLSMLLKRDADDPYPWAVNANDLELFFEALALKGWGLSELISYLEQRQRLQGRTRPADELELAGMFLKHGRLADPPNGGLLIANPSYSDIFDEIFSWKQGGAPPDLSTQEEIFISPADESIFGQRSTNSMRRSRQTRVGRNERCPCGSGTKFKKCCGG